MNNTVFTDRFLSTEQKEFLMKYNPETLIQMETADQKEIEVGMQDILDDKDMPAKERIKILMKIYDPKDLNMTSSDYEKLMSFVNLNPSVNNGEIADFIIKQIINPKGDPLQGNRDWQTAQMLYDPNSGDKLYSFVGKLKQEENSIINERAKYLMSQAG